MSAAALLSRLKAIYGDVGCLGGELLQRWYSTFACAEYTCL